MAERIDMADEEELVCMFFDSTEDRDEFIAAMPGDYQVMRLNGISYDDFEVELP